MRDLNRCTIKIILAKFCDNFKRKICLELNDDENEIDKDETLGHYSFIDLIKNKDHEGIESF